MATKITLTKTPKGDFEMHVAGCADLKVRARHASDDVPTTYSGETVLDAILEADADMAGWFVEKRYTDSAVENGCWTTSAVAHAPCFTALLRGERIEFDARTGRPSTRPLKIVETRSYETVVADARKARADAKKTGKSPAAAVAKIIVGTCRGKWSRCGGENTARSESWHLCEACSAGRTKEMAK